MFKTTGKLKLLSFLITVFLLVTFISVSSQKICTSAFSVFYIDNSALKAGVSMIGTAGETFVGVKQQGEMNYFEGFLSLNDMFLDQNNSYFDRLVIYPNPAGNFLYLSCSPDSNLNRITLIEVTGKIVMDKKIEYSNKIELPFNIQPGVYIAKLYNLDNRLISTQSIIKR